MSEPDYGEVTVEGVDSRLKVLEHQFGRALRDILKLQLQVEKLERNANATGIAISRFDQWKPKYIPIKDDSGSSD